VNKTKKVKILTWKSVPQAVGDIIEVMIVKLSRKSGGGRKDKKAPAWFSNFITNEFKPLIDKIDNGFKQVNDRIDNLVTKNSLKE
jgi:hypothetical protein